MASTKKKTSKEDKTNKAKKTSTSKADKAKKAGSGSKRNPLAPKTWFAKEGEVKETWRLIDATNLTLGRLSSEIAKILMGKHRPTYTAFTDTGDHVIVINASKVALTGKKWEDKEYNYHTNYPGGIKTFKAKEILVSHPERLVQWAVWGMLPKSKGHMVRHWYKKLRVFPNAEHPHKAQMPQEYKVAGASKREA